MENRKIIISVSGQNFVTSVKTLTKYPNTKLGQLVTSSAESVLNFEGDTEIFKEILKFYWTDQLHCPKNICSDDFKAHLDFWEIDISYVSQCCVGDIREDAALKQQFDYFDQRLDFLDGRSVGPGCCNRFRYRVWCFLTNPTSTDSQCPKAALVWAIFYVLLTLFTGLIYSFGTKRVLTFAALTNRTNSSSCEDYFTKWSSSQLIWDFSILMRILIHVYAAEILIRFLCCPDKKRFFRSIHVLDLMITLIEVSYFMFCTPLWYMIVQNPKPYPNHLEVLCRIADHLDVCMVIIEQLRLNKLFHYASVYR